MSNVTIHHQRHHSDQPSQVVRCCDAYIRGQLELSSYHKVGCPRLLLSWSEDRLAQPCVERFWGRGQDRVLLWTLPGGGRPETPEANTYSVMRRGIRDMDSSPQTASTVAPWQSEVRKTSPPIRKTSLRINETGPPTSESAN